MRARDLGGPVALVSAAFDPLFYSLLSFSRLMAALMILLAVVVWIGNELVPPVL